MYNTRERKEIMEKEEQVYNAIVFQCKRICDPNSVTYRLKGSVIKLSEIASLVTRLSKIVEPEEAVNILWSLIGKGKIRAYDDGFNISFIPEGYWHYNENGKQIEYVSAQNQLK